MATVVPESGRGGGADESAWPLGTILDSLLGFTQATAGWIGLIDARGRLTFPVRRGDFPDAWLTLQQGRGDVWGFAIRDGPTLLNELKPFPATGQPAIQNLLSCRIGTEDEVRGHIVLANKPNGFTSYDSAVVQGFAHLLGKWLGQARGPDSALLPPPPPWRLVLDGVGRGVVILEEDGTLVYANSTWLDWAGFAAAEVVGKLAPFPFWIGHRELAEVGVPVRGAPAGSRPFRRRDHSLFWCQVQTASVSWEGRRLTVAYLEREPTQARAAREDQPKAVLEALDGLAFGVALVDHAGRLLWSNPTLGRLAPAPPAPDAAFRDRFSGTSAARLDRLVQRAGGGEVEGAGRLVLRRQGVALTALWLRVDLADGPGLLFALTDDPKGFPEDGEGESEALLEAALPSPDWLPLLLRPGGEVGYWNERWEKRTGLTVPPETRSELVLDWLFPRQRDREKVADWTQQAARRGGQAVLDVVTPTGSRPMLCTLLPVEAAAGEAANPRGADWLLLVGEPTLFPGEGGPSRGFVRQFARGLGLLLNQYLTVPIGLSEEALGRTDLPAPVGAWFQQILDSCQKSSRLLSALEDLAAVSPGETQRVSLADVVREALEELPPAPERNYELRVELGDTEVPVRVNRRMIRTVLRHLLSNAVQSLADSNRRQIEVRVSADAETARCEVRDSGEGFPAEAWIRMPLPFVSTNGPFARDPEHAALEATGLGLIVCRHLLTLHHGRLDLTSAPGGGTTAALILPRADLAPDHPAARGTESVRADSPAGAPGPHQPIPRPSLSERPEPR